jgi:hypothetical protein
MKWVRQHIRSCAWLALMALAIHFVLTFGHVHLEEFSRTPAAPVSVAGVDAKSGANSGAGGDTPAPRRQVHHTCAVCVSISMLSAPLPPVAHKLAPPRALSVQRRDCPGTVRPCELRFSFEARAPPLA